LDRVGFDELGHINLGVMMGMVGEERGCVRPQAAAASGGGAAGSERKEDTRFERKLRATFARAIFVGVSQHMNFAVRRMQLTSSARLHVA
jgi:hypothetical protein